MTPEERTHAINEFRALYNEHLASVGFQAPPPIAGETVGGYRRRAVQTFADSLLPQTHQWAKVNFTNKDKMPFDVFKNFETQVIRDCAYEARNPANVPKGELKMVPIYDPQTGRRKMNTWIGQECFVKQPAYSRPGRRAIINMHPESTNALRAWHGAQGI